MDGIRTTFLRPSKKEVENIVSLAREYKITQPSLVVDLWAVFESRGKPSTLKSVALLHKQAKAEYEKGNSLYPYVSSEVLQRRMLLQNVSDSWWFQLFDEGNGLASLRKFLQCTRNLAEKVAAQSPLVSTGGKYILPPDTEGWFDTLPLWFMDLFGLFQQMHPQFFSAGTAPIYSAHYNGRPEDAKRVLDLVSGLADRKFLIYLLARKIEAGLQVGDASPPVVRSVENAQSIETSFGSDIKRTVSSEFAKPEDLFYKKVADKALLLKEPMSPVEKKQVIYLLMDETSSMLDRFSPGLMVYEQAQAVGMALLGRARTRDAWLYYQGFTGSVGVPLVVEDAASAGVAIARLLSCRFQGNYTRIDVALKSALDNIRYLNDEEKLKEADIVMVSDGFSRVEPSDILQDRKGLPTRLHLLYVGVRPDFFDSAEGKLMAAVFDTVLKINFAKGTEEFASRYKGIL